MLFFNIPSCSMHVIIWNIFNYICNAPGMETVTQPFVYRGRDPVPRVAVKREFTVIKFKQEISRVKLVKLDITI